MTIPTRAVRRICQPNPLPESPEPSDGRNSQPKVRKTLDTAQLAVLYLLPQEASATPQVAGAVAAARLRARRVGACEAAIPTSTPTQAVQLPLQQRAFPAEV